MCTHNIDTPKCITVSLAPGQALVLNRSTLVNAATDLQRKYFHLLVDSGVDSEDSAEWSMSINAVDYDEFREWLERITPTLS